eukprot:scaffold21924_cov62-Phaeocystis_antarctica.AAC.12
MSHRTRASKKLKTCSTRSSDSLQMIAPRLREAELRVPIAPRFGAGRPGAIEFSWDGERYPGTSRLVEEAAELAERSASSLRKLAKFQRATGALSMSALRELHSWVDGRINVKTVYRRLQVAARFLVVGTFADDSIRVTFDYSGQVSTMQSVGFGLPLASILPAVFIMTQGVSVFLIISEFAPEAGCAALLVWTGLHPFIYKQERNQRARLEGEG